MGASSGLNVAAAIRVAKEMGPGHTIVTCLCDTGQVDISPFTLTDPCTYTAVYLSMLFSLIFQKVSQPTLSNNILFTPLFLKKR